MTGERSGLEVLVFAYELILFVEGLWLTTHQTAVSCLVPFVVTSSVNSRSSSSNSMQDPAADEAKAGVMEAGGAPSSSTMREVPVEDTVQPPMGDSASSSSLVQSCLLYTSPSPRD